MLRQLGLACVIIACLFLCPTTRGAADDAQLHQQAVQWVEQLGSDSFRVRQRAEHQLAQLGVPGKTALMAGLKSDDAEIRDRCRRLLIVVLEQDYQARVEAFAADTQGRHDYHLPGWDRFRALAGESGGARQLFVEMQRSESKLLEIAAADPDAGSEMLLARCEDLQHSVGRQLDDDGHPLTLGSILAAFFTGADPRLPMNDRIASYLYNFSYQPALQRGMDGGPKLEAIKRTLGAWVLRTANTNNAYPGMVLAMQYDLREGLEPAVGMLKQTGGPPHFVQFAILVIGRFGNQEQLGLLQPLLDNATPLISQNHVGQPLRCEIRDVALAALVHLTQQDFKQYGLGHLQRNTQTLFNINTLGFTSEEARTNALRKWQSWLANRP